MKMNIANKLTILRVCLVPVFVVVFMTNLLPAPWNRSIAFLIFAFASYTAHLDGHLARSRGLVTNFGKFMAPLADHLLVVSALICFVAVSYTHLFHYMTLLCQVPAGWRIILCAVAAAGMGAVVFPIHPPAEKTEGKAAP